MITIKFYQVFCEKNKMGKLEPVAGCMQMEKALILARRGNAGEFDKQWRTGKPPYQVREMEYDLDLISKEERF